MKFIELLVIYFNTFVLTYFQLWYILYNIEYINKVSFAGK